MEQPSVYHLSQQSLAKSKRTGVIVMGVLYGVIVSFLLYRILSAPFTWDKDGMNMVWIAFCIGSPMYWYRKQSTQLTDSKVEIGVGQVTVYMAPRIVRHIDFADIKTVKSFDHGLALIHKTESKKSVIISSKYEDFDEIEARIRKECDGTGIAENN